MNRPEILNYGIQVVKNTIPFNHTGEILNDGLRWGFDTKVENGLFKITALVQFNIERNGIIIYEFVTTKLFTVNNSIDHDATFLITCDFITMAIKETNAEYGKLESILSRNKQYPIPSLNQLYPQVIATYRRLFPDWFKNEEMYSPN